MRVAVGQIEIKLGDKTTNVIRIEQAIETAARRGSDILVLPECPLGGWLSLNTTLCAEPIPGKFTRWLCDLARTHDIAIACGIEERDRAKLFNSAILIDRSGQLLARHRKINELEIGLRVYTRGQSLRVVDLDGVLVALTICADSWVPYITEALYLMGARLILSPCAWAIQPGQEAQNESWLRHQYGLRTASRDLYLVGANSVGSIDSGPWTGKVLHGNSLMFGPGGRQILCGPTNAATVITADIEPSHDS